MTLLKRKCEIHLKSGLVTFYQLKTWLVTSYQLVINSSPISSAHFFNFDSVRDIRTTFIPFLASSFAYSKPIPSVLPVIAKIKKKKL